MLNDFALVVDSLLTGIDSHGLPQLYQALINAYTSAASQVPEESTVTIEAAEEGIRTAQKEIQPKGWNYSLMKYYDFVNSSSDLGEAGLMKMDQAIGAHQNDPKGTATEVQGLLNSLTETIKRIRSVKEGLKIDPQAPKLEDGHDLLELVFDEAVAVSNLDDLSKASRTWEVILKDLSVLNGGAEGKIYSVSKSSPLIIIIVASVPTLLTLRQISDLVLDTWKGLLEVRKIQKEIEKLDGEIALNKGKQAIQDLEDSVLKKIEEGIDKIAESVIGEHDKKKKKGEAKLDGDQKAHIKHGVENMFAFITNGGEVNVVVNQTTPETPEDEGARVKLAKDYVDAKKLSKDLGNPKFIDAPDPDKDQPEAQQPQPKVTTKAKPKKEDSKTTK